MVLAVRADASGGTQAWSYAPPGRAAPAGSGRRRSRQGFCSAGWRKPDASEDAEPTTDTESDAVADNDPAIEPDPTPAPEGDEQADNPAVDEVQEEGPPPVEEPDSETAQPPSSEPETDSTSEPRPSGESGSEADTQPAAETSPNTRRRPRNRTSKRRPKTSSTCDATVYRRWKSRAELAAEALDHAGLTDCLVPVVIGPGRLREELVATMTRALWEPEHFPRRPAHGPV